LDEAEVVLYVATGREGKKDLSLWKIVTGGSRSQILNMTIERNCITCPGGHTLELKYAGEDASGFYQAKAILSEVCLLGSVL